MKWTSHKILTGSIIFSLSGGDLILTGASIIGSVFPDAIEKIPYYFGYTRKNHRQLSHWFIPYFILFITLYHGAQPFVLNDTISNLLNRSLSMSFYIAMTRYILAGVFLGASFHIMEDALCGTVPFLTPKQRIGTLLFNVGSTDELLFVLLTSLGFISLSFKV